MLKLPHPELAECLIPIKRSIIGKRRSTVAGTELSYAVFRPGPDMPYREACYDEDGTIYMRGARISPQGQQGRLDLGGRLLIMDVEGNE